MIFQYWRKCRLTSEFSFMRWALAECSIQKGQILNGRMALPQWRRRSIRQEKLRIVQRTRTALLPQPIPDRQCAVSAELVPPLWAARRGFCWRFRVHELQG